MRTPAKTAEVAPRPELPRNAPRPVHPTRGQVPVRCRGENLAPVRYAPFDRHGYAVQGILGGGAFGTVFHCLDRYARDEDEQPTPVAIKSFRGEKLGSDLGRVFREAGTTKLLRHDSIIGVLDQGFGDPAGQVRPYLVLEYFPGQSLDCYLAENGPLPVADFLAVARQVAEAVHSRPRSVGPASSRPVVDLGPPTALPFLAEVTIRSHAILMVKEV